MRFPETIKYSEDHEWIRHTEAGTAFIGITDYAQTQLSSLVFINLPEVGDTVTMGERFCDVESVKAVSDVFSPVTGVVKAINETLLSAPEEINADPYEAWFIEVENITETESLISAAQYEAYCKEQEG